MLTNKIRPAFTVLMAIVLLCSSVLTYQTAFAQNVNNTCKMATAVFARGSGQEINQQSSETSRFRDQLENRIGVDNINFYELGSEQYGGYQYPAVNVGNVLNGNAIGAKLSGGMGNDYGRSVEQGVKELQAFLKERHQRCSQEFFILGGYSQGAQVIGQAMSGIDSSVKNKIVFSAMFGDPKLHLPEGEGFNPPACRNENLSVYRREIANCDVDNGSLGARKPYLSAEDGSKSGLWCLGKDYVCGSYKLVWETSGHMEYGKDNGPIDAAAREAAERLKQATIGASAEEINDKPTNNNLGTAGTDVVFVLDTTGSMSPYIDQTKQFIRDYSAKIKELNGRVGLVLFRDLGDEYTAKKVSDLQSDTTDLLGELELASAEGGGDDPEAALHAIMTALNTMEWQTGATKAIILLTDATFHAPDQVDGTTVDMVVKRSLEIDPVNVYPLISEYDKDFYTELADQTSGQVIVNNSSDETVTALTIALTKIKNRPNVKLKINDYRAEIGQTVTFDASDSYVVDANITKYEWDFNGDGTIDQITDTPVTSHVYNEKFDGVMQVRVWADNDTVSNFSTTVKIGVQTEKPATPSAPKVEAKIIERNGTTATIRLTWQANDTLADKWIIRQNDTNLGYAVGSQTQVDITDVDISRDVEYSVVGVTSEGYAGEIGRATVSAGDSSLPEDASVKPCPYKLRVGPIEITCQYQKTKIFKWSFYVIVWHIRWIGH